MFFTGNAELKKFFSKCRECKVRVMKIGIENGENLVIFKLEIKKLDQRSIRFGAALPQTYIKLLTPLSWRQGLKKHLKALLPVIQAIPGLNYYSVRRLHQPTSAYAILPWIWANDKIVFSVCSRGACINEALSY